MNRPARGVVTAPVTVRVPLLATCLWHEVVAEASGRCECTGWCGSRHSRTQGRCPVGTDRPGQALYVAARNPAVRDVVHLPPAELAAWCGPCLDSAVRRHRAPVPAEIGPALFDLPGHTDQGTKHPSDNTTTSQTC